MVFDFYYRLPPRRRALYERSERLAAPPLPGETFRPLAAALREALESGRQPAVRVASQKLADAFSGSLRLPPVRVTVRRTRPERGGSEYHGYYEGGEDAEPARITVWMYTARRRQVVAFRTFLRTLVHELAHHLDFEGFRLEESFHTERFYQRESSLFRDIVGEMVEPRAGREPLRR